MARVIHRFPPNYGAIAEKFPSIKGRRGVVFTFWPHIYVPGQLQLDHDLMRHEETHLEQQESIGPSAWWERYLRDPEFRLQQELEAYRVQYKACEIYNRKKRRAILDKISSDLAGPMYGGLVTKQEAMELIREVNQ